MPRVVIEFDKKGNIPRLLKMLQARTDAVTPALVPIVEKYLKTLRTNARRYPPPPEGSRYVRTFKLRRSWKIKPAAVRSKEVVGSIHTDGSAKYDIKVMLHGHQDPIHEGRWHTDKTMADEIGPSFKRALLRKATKVLRGTPGETSE